MALGPVQAAAIVPYNEFLRNPSSGRKNTLVNSARLQAMRRESAAGDSSRARLLLRASRLLDSSLDLTLGHSRSVFVRNSMRGGNGGAAAGSSEPYAASGRYNIEVTKPAGSVTVASDAISTNTPTAAFAGSYRFEANAGGESHNVDVTITRWDTVESGLNKIADAINELDAGVTASVKLNRQAQTARLYVEGIKKDDLSTVNFRDVGGGLLETIGLNSNERTPLPDVGIEELKRIDINERIDLMNPQQGGVVAFNDDAEFKLNGAELQSDSNRLAVFDQTGFVLSKAADPLKSAGELYDQFVDNGYKFPAMVYSSPRSGGAAMGAHRGEVELNGAGTAELSIAEDREAIGETIRDFVENHNGTMEELGAKPVSSYRALREFIDVAMEKRAAELEGIGIRQNGNGYEVENSVLESEIESRLSDIARLFGGTDGIARKTLFAAAKILYAPVSGVNLAPSFSGRAEAHGLVFDTLG